MSSELTQRIWQIVAAIPAGSVSSYGEIARQAGAPNHARFVARVLKQLPSDSRLPWHRVVNAQRKIAFVAGSDNYQRQLQALQAEGVVFINGRIPTQYLAWSG